MTELIECKEINEGMKPGLLNSAFISIFLPPQFNLISNQFNKLKRNQDLIEMRWRQRRKIE